MTNYAQHSTRYALHAILLASVLLLLSARPAAAQSAADIIEQAEAAHQEMAEQVRSFTVETERETNRFVREEQDGHYVYRIRESSGSATAQEMPIMGGLETSYLNGLKEAATYEGTESIDGVSTHAIHVDDPSQLASYANVGEQEFQTLRSMRLYLRTDNMMPARIVFEAVLPEDAMEGAPFQIDDPVTFQMDFRDYRTIDGLVYPFVTEMRNDMVEQIPEQQRQRMQQMRAQMEQQMEQMSPEQRRMMEEQMSEGFAQMQAMMSGEPVRTTVTNVTVNE